jgi:hypothetical protein
LENLEARAVTIAMFQLKRKHGALALPVHDSLIVETKFFGRAVDAIEAAYGEVVGLMPKLDARSKFKGHPHAK